MHHIHHTKALVLSSKNQGEANKLFTLYTRELGVLIATAQGIRLERSKLRFALQDFSLVSVDLVRGKDIWRITSGTHERSYVSLLNKPESRKLLTGSVKLTVRLMAGETPDPQFFDEYVYTLSRIADENLESEDIVVAEFCLILRMLHRLGYVSDHEELAPYISGSMELNSFSYEALPRKRILEAINRALRESQL